MEEASVEIGREQKGPRILSLAETLSKAKKDFSPDFIKRQTEFKHLDEFISEHVQVVHDDGIDFTVIDQEWDNDFPLDDGDSYLIHPILKAYIQSPRTKLAVVEYFDPELARNAAETPIIGRKLSQLYQGENKNQKITDRNHPRISYYTQMAQVVKEAGKPIAVTDIADKPTYQAYKIASKGSLSLAIPASIIASLTGHEIDLYAGIYAALTLPGAIMESSRSGMFDKDKIHGFEKFLLDIEDARRLFAAKGGKQLMSEYTTEGRVDENGEPVEDAQIVFVNPKAHARRVVDYMTNNTEADVKSRNVKNLLYRLMPNLDISVRTWMWKDTMARLSGNDSYARWEKISDRKIAI